MNYFTAVFLAALAAATGIEVWLAQRQIHHVHTHRAEVPQAFQQQISLRDHQQAADYTLARMRLARVGGLFDSALLLVWTLGGGLSLLNAGWQGLHLPPLITQVAVVMSVFLITALVSLPLSVYRTFGIEQRFGFNRTSPSLFIADILKQGAISVLLITPLVAVILWLMGQAGAWWWVYAWAVWIGFSFTLTWGYPRLIAPRFNRFTPLQDPELKSRIERLLEKCGFSSQGIFVMDSSRRSAHSNAYFTGLGRNKRIVFFDTLLDMLAPDETEAVLAHELGHFRLHHIRNRLLSLAVMSLGGLALLGWLYDQSWFYSGLGVEQPAPHMALLLFTLVGPVFGFFLRPVMASLSRLHEFQADNYAAKHSDAGALMRALVKLYKDNATTLTPDPVYSWYYDSHPPAITRIDHLSHLTATPNSGPT